MKFRIRNILMVAYLAIGLLPLGLLTWITYDRMLSSEHQEVKDRHLLIAQNLSSALSRYEKDVRAAVSSISKNLESRGKIGDIENLLEAFEIQNIAIVNSTSGNILASISDVDKNRYDPSLLSMLTEYALNQDFNFTPVWKSPSGENVIFTVAKSGDNFLVGKIGTGYFQKLGSQISFGSKGHAAIVDQHGNVLSHPLDSWIKQAKNLSAISAVNRMMNGETGIEQFYSPALKGDVIAGLTSVIGPGWGVMIPQPVAELKAKAIENLIPMLIGFALTAMITLIFIAKSIQCLARPLENLNQDMLEQSKIGTPKAIPPMRTATNIIELEGIVDAYNDLALTTQNNSNELAHKVYEDMVTGIGNRLYFNTVSEQQIDLRLSKGQRGILMFLDLDGFKEINDIRGHAIGDQVLKEFAKSLYPTTKRFMDEKFKGITGSYPVIGRLGGDEFAILLPLPEETENISETCEELRQLFPTTTQIDGSEISFGVSAGGADYPNQGTDVDELIRRADVALYMAKSEGKGRFNLYEKQNTLGNKSEILAGVMQAIDNDELVLHYQPKYCIKKQNVTGVEALLRWNHPVHGIVAPNLFLPAIQQTVVMSKLGNWVISKAIKDISEMEKTGHFLNVAVNIGTEHFSTPEFVPELISRCKSQNFSHSRMQIEITENIMDSSRKIFKRTVQKLQKNGFIVAIDDFGSGFSNLSRIASVPVDIIKLDRSLIKHATTDERVHVIMETAIKMAHALDSAVIVEGVETLKQIKIAEKAGANALQGFYFSKALPADELVAWLDTRESNTPHKQLKDLREAVA